MMRKSGKALIFGMLLWIGLITAACGEAAQPAEQPTLEPLVYVTQYVTQVVATRAPSTPAPIPTAAMPTGVSSGGWDPLAQPIYYPITGCVASRLHIGDRAFVAYVNSVAGIYQGKDIFYAPLFRKPEPGEILEILDGPWCQRGNLIWQVYALGDELIGFAPEGNGQEYWLLPMQPPTPTP